jgi:hypothetical protein
MLGINLNCGFVAAEIIQVATFIVITPICVLTLLELGLYAVGLKYASRSA